MNLLPIQVEQPQSLQDYLPSLQGQLSPLLTTRGAAPQSFVSDSEVVLSSPVMRIEDSDDDKAVEQPPRRAFLRAGPRQTVAFNPAEVRAAVVTCGGICPGLNTVVRELVLCLR